MKLLIHLTFLSLLLSSPCVAQSLAEQQDARVIENLVSAGSDVSKPHKIDFLMLMPTRIKAADAAADMKQLGYSVISIDRASGQSQWEIHGTREMVPQLEAMTATTRALEAVAGKHGGDYDGWGTEVVK